MTGPPNLTGCWEGFYTYSQRAIAVGFGATLIETPGWLTGSIQEICTDGPDRGAMICATLEGHRRDHAVSFEKRYEEGELYQNPVHYDGILNDDATEIEGVWRIFPHWTGRFLMIRSGSASIEERREAFEKAK